MAKKEENTTIDCGLLDDGTVVLQFGKLIQHMTFTPEQAVALGVGLIQNARSGESLRRVSATAKGAQGSKRVQ